MPLEYLVNVVGTNQGKNVYGVFLVVALVVEIVAPPTSIVSSKVKNNDTCAT